MIRLVCLIKTNPDLDKGRLIIQKDNYSKGGRGLQQGKGNDCNRKNAPTMASTSISEGQAENKRLLF